MSKNDVIRQLVDALESVATWHSLRLHAQFVAPKAMSAIAAGEAELAKPEPEPVMWGSWAWDGMKNVCVPAHPPKDGKERPKLFPLYTTPPEPKGWKLVPVNPTKDMRIAGKDNIDAGYYEESSNLVEATEDDAYDVWKAMLSSAPDYKG